MGSISSLLPQSLITKACMHMCEARDATRQLYYLHVAMMTFTGQNVHQPLKKGPCGVTLSHDCDIKHDCNNK